jgi:hypothetical protein
MARPKPFTSRAIAWAGVARAEGAEAYDFDRRFIDSNVLDFGPFAASFCREMAQ